MEFLNLNLKNDVLVTLCFINKKAGIVFVKYMTIELCSGFLELRLRLTFVLSLVLYFIIGIFIKLSLCR